MPMPKPCPVPRGPHLVPDGLWREREGRDWPNGACSRFVEAGGLRWHVQRAGHGPVLLLAHGTGAATHSWRDLLPLLARHFDVVAPDLPGHGFTARPRPGSGLSLPGMANSLGALLRKLEARPAITAGHSAGAAILARMSLDGAMAPKALVSLNGAFLPPSGPAAPIFSPLAKLLARIELVPRLFAWHVADRAVVERLLRATGSTIDATGTELYARLMRRPEHAGAALGMMANWQLMPLWRDLPKLRPALTVVVGGNDRTVPPADASRIAGRVPGATVVELPGLGHLAHEENPAAIAALIERIARANNLLPPA